MKTYILILCLSLRDFITVYKYLAIKLILHLMILKYLILIKKTL